MNSLSELEDAVIGHLVKTKHKGRINKYEALIRSAVKLDASGCDGWIMVEVESTIERTLSGLRDEDLYAIWEETENGQLTPEEGTDLQCRTAMIHDICMEAIQAIAKTVCSEAEGRVAKKRRKA